MGENPVFFRLQRMKNSFLAIPLHLNLSREDEFGQARRVCTHIAAIFLPTILFLYEYFFLSLLFFFFFLRELGSERKLAYF